MKKYLLLLIILISFFFAGCSSNSKEDRFTIISSSFPGYDFARAIVKNADDVEVKMLLKPGSEMHDFEPTPQDIINIKNCDVFIYVGGESDSWIDDILDDIDTSKTKIIKLMDFVDVVEEEEVPGMEEEVEEGEEEIEYDEHVWTSPVNVITIIEKLKNEFIKIDKENSSLYQENADNYITQLKNIDSQIRDIVSQSKRKELVFGDRFPFRYFTDEYGLSYSAAFKGCSEQSEASAKTITFLINKIKDNDIPVVLHIELSNKNIANTISKETGAKVLEFNSAHNITQKDFDDGITYVDMMEKNIEVLKEALN